MRRSVSRRSRPRSSGAGPGNNTTPLLLTDGKSKPNAEKNPLSVWLIMAALFIVAAGLLVLLYFHKYKDVFNMAEEDVDVDE